MTIKAALRLAVAASVIFESENLESAQFTFLHHHLRFEDKPAVTRARHSMPNDLTPQVKRLKAGIDR